MALPLVTQIVDIDDLGTSVEVETRYIKDDYGVPNSPVFYTMGDLDFHRDHVYLFGVKVLNANLPKELLDTLLELAYEVIDEQAWEAVE